MQKVLNHRLRVLSRWSQYTMLCIIGFTIQIHIWNWREAIENGIKPLPSFGDNHPLESTTFDDGYSISHNQPHDRQHNPSLNLPCPSTSPHPQSPHCYVLLRLVFTQTAEPSSIPSGHLLLLVFNLLRHAVHVQELASARRLLSPEQALCARAPDRQCRARDGLEDLRGAQDQG